MKPATSKIRDLIDPKTHDQLRRLQGKLSRPATRREELRLRYTRAQARVMEALG